MVESRRRAGSATDRPYVMLLPALHKIRSWYWTRRYRAGRTMTQFIACDVRRDVEIVDASQAATGVLTVKTRTWNVLYAIRGIEPEPPFGDVRQVAIRDLWGGGKGDRSGKRGHSYILMASLASVTLLPCQEPEESLPAV